MSGLVWRRKGGERVDQCRGSLLTRKKLAENSVLMDLSADKNGVWIGFILSDGGVSHDEAFI